MSPTAETPIRIARQRFKLRVWITSRLWAQVIAGMVLGFALGLFMSQNSELLAPGSMEIIGLWLALPAKIFMALIAMVLVPLIFCSIVAGLMSAASGTELRSVGLRLGAFILATTAAAATGGILLASWLKPGEGLGAASSPASPAMPSAAADAAPALPLEQGVAALPEMIAAILPANPTASIVQGDMLAIVVLALLVGISVMQVERERAQPFLALVDALLSISMNIVKWAMFLTPYAVFGLMVQLVTRIGLETVLGMSVYVGTVLLGLALLLTLYLLIAGIFTRTGPAEFLKKAGGNLLLAFSTSSSSAVMPVTIQTARRLGVPGNIANIVIPLGATMNMAGTALYQAVAILFLAQLSGVELSLAQIAIVTGTLIASSIGAPGTPGVSIAILSSVALSMNIPVEGMVIILGVDRLLDMCRTAVNVTGDLTAALLLQGVSDSQSTPGAPASA